jgi:hypothetical protein
MARPGRGPALRSSRLRSIFVHMKALYGLILACQPVAQPAITVHAQQWAGSVGPMLASSGDEIVQYLGQDGLDDLIASTGIQLLRMGGIAAEYYDWEGLGYEGAWYIDFIPGQILVLPTEGSLDDLLQTCEQVGIEPVLTVNFQVNDPAKAARFVEYCNGDITTPMGSVRASRGHPAPYDVTQWCIGNEPDISGGTYPTAYGDWTFYRHFGIPFESWAPNDSVFCTAAGFSDLVGEYIPEMRAASPIPIKIGGLSLAGDLDWIPAVIGPNSDEIDWMDAHYYPVWAFSSDSSMYPDFLWAPDYGTTPLEARYAQLRESIDAASGGNDIPLYIYEYNIAVMVADEAWWNYLDGLVVADCLGHLAHAGARRAAVYSIAEGMPGSADFPLFGAIRTDTLSMRSSAWVLKLWNERFGHTLLETDCSEAMPYGLEAWSSMRQDGRISILVTNRDLAQPQEAWIGLDGFVSGGQAESWQITNDAPIQAPWNGTTGIAYLGFTPVGASGFSWTFPRASVTCIQVIPTAVCPGEEGGSPLLAASPNPSTGSVAITFPAGFPTGCVEIRDIAGRLVRSILPDDGVSTLVWDGSGRDCGRVPPGIYAATSGSLGARIVLLP